MGLFDGFLSSDSKFSDLKRFVGDFEIIEVKDKNGRMRKKALYTGVWTVLRDAGTATRAKMYAAAATAFVLIAAYIWSLLLTHVGSGSLLVMLPLLAGLFPALYLIFGVLSLPFDGHPMRRDQYMHSFIRASRSAVAIDAFILAGLLGLFIYRSIQGDWLFLPEDWRFIAGCVFILMLSGGIILTLRSIDLTEKENKAYESKPL